MINALKERSRSLLDALLALSLVNLCFIRARSGLFFDENLRYYKQLALNRQALSALALNLILFGFVAWRLIRWVRRSESRLLNRVACVVACGLLFIPIDFIRTFYFHMMGSEVVAWGKNPLFIGAGLPILFSIWRWPRFVLHVLGAGLLIFVPAMLLTVGKIGYYSLTVRPEVQPQTPPLFPTATPSVEPRVVWIIYDELDQRVAFTSRPNGCQLPELDRVYDESLHATNAFPPGGSTIISLPALTTGRYVVRAKPVSRNELNITYAGTNTPVGWSTQPTIFSRARELGFNTALVGWYHPYSRLFSSSLNFCAWYPYPPYQQSRGRTVIASMINQIWALASPLQQRRLLIDVYQKSLADSRDLVKDGRYGLVMLHLPGAHFPGIYDSAKGKFTLTCFSRSRGYFQNLQLTDKTMGILRRDMEQSGQWDRSWVIVTSDHWWREARVYDGNLDYHIPFMVKAPGRNQPMTYGAPLNTVVTHDLILAILRKEISTIPETAAWLDTHQAPPAPSYASMQAN